MKGKTINMCFDLLARRALDLQLRSLAYDGYKAPCVFTRIEGHVKELNVDLHTKGWKPDQKPSVYASCYEDNPDKFGLMKKTLDYIETVLDKWEAENES